MSNCTSGCKSQDHESYAECLRAKNPQVGWADSVNRLDLTREKKWQKEIDFYRSAVAQGVDPDGTSTAKVRRALDISDKTGVAYGAQNGANGG